MLSGNDTSPAYYLTTLGSTRREFLLAVPVNARLGLPRVTRERPHYDTAYERDESRHLIFVSEGQDKPPN